MTLPKFFLLKLLKSEVLSVRFQNRSKKVTSISIIRNLPNGSFGHVKGFFDKLSTVVLATPNCFIQNGNCSNRIMSFWKNCIFGKKIQRTRDLGFRQSCRNFQAKNRRLHFQGQHWWREFFFKNFKFGQILLRTTGVQFHRTCQKIKAKVTLFLCLRADKIGKPIHFSAKSFFFKCFLDTKKAILTTPRQSFC